MCNPDFLRNGIIGSILLFAMVAFLMTVVLKPCKSSASDSFLPGDPKTGKTLTPAGDLSADKIIGTWKLISMTYQDKSTEKETDLWGKDPIGFLSDTPGGRMSVNIAAADRKITAPSAGQASIEEQAMVFRNAFGYAGTYTLTKDGVIHHVEVASDPTWIGQDQVRVIRIEGNRLIVTGEPLRTVGDPNLKVLQLIWERIE